MKFDSRTPVVVGAGQVSERLDQPGYRRRSAADLAGDAARAALADCGGRAGAVAETIDTIAGVRQFDISLPGAEAPLGRSASFPRSVAARIGANRSRPEPRTWCCWPERRFSYARTASPTRSVTGVVRRPCGRADSIVNGPELPGSRP